MRTLISTFIVLVVSAVASAQSSDLPSILVPSDQAKQEASRLGASVVKMLPRFLLNNDAEKQPDSEAVLGIRGNGAFYSFSTKAHSLNNIREIMLAEGEFAVVSSFGLMANLGPYDLNKLTEASEIPALKVLSSYRPPTTEEREEQTKILAAHGRAGIKVSEGWPARLGHSYLLRAISTEKADILVAFTVFRIEKDGSLEMIWKALEQRVPPAKLYLSDVDLRLAIQRIIDENGIFKTVTFDVLDSNVRLAGHTSRREFEVFMKAVDGIRTRSIGGKLDEDK